jgi:DNA repair protein RadA/Sms
MTYPDSNEQKYLSFVIRKLSREYNCAFIVIGQVNHDKRQSGPMMLAHNFDVSLVMEKGINDELIVSTPNKNRLGPTGNRAVFRKTDCGFVAKSEIETGYILRHSEQLKVGIAAFVTETKHDYSVDELTVTVNTESKKSGLALDGSSKSRADFLVSVSKRSFSDFDPYYIARANFTEKLGRSSELACVIAMLSLFYNKPLPIDTAFLASLDSAGKLLPLDNMRRRYKRAVDQGYTQVFGPKAIGSQEAMWIEAEHFTDVWKALAN